MKSAVGTCHGRVGGNDQTRLVSEYALGCALSRKNRLSIDLDVCGIVGTGSSDVGNDKGGAGVVGEQCCVVAARLCMGNGIASSADVGSIKGVCRHQGTK